MVRKILKNKPLVEAIFELRWELQTYESENDPETQIITSSQYKTDPHYNILIGSIYEKVKDEYPFHEKLPTATMPDVIAGHIPQHRFRHAKDEWPLIQLGPGIITLNNTEKYVWKDFEKRISNVIENLFDSYPDAENNLKVSELVLRYIDAIDFDYNNDVFKFIKENLKMNIEIYEKLFEDTGVHKEPKGLDIRCSFKSTKPNGKAFLRLGRGKRVDGTSDGILWETMVKSSGDDTPKKKEDIIKWVKEAHNLTDDWFFKMIEGELERRFE